MADTLPETRPHDVSSHSTPPLFCLQRSTQQGRYNDDEEKRAKEEEEAANTKGCLPMNHAIRLAVRMQAAPQLIMISLLTLFTLSNHLGTNVLGPALPELFLVGQTR